MKDDLIETMCREGEFGSGSGRKWEELRFRELNFRSLESEMPAGHLSKLQKASQCQNRAREEDPAGLALHLMLAKKTLLPIMVLRYLLPETRCSPGTSPGLLPIKAKRSHASDRIGNWTATQREINKHMTATLKLHIMIFKMS